MTTPPSKPWRRPQLDVTRPQRGFGAVLRSAEGESAGESFGGVPMQAASDAIVAAVQLGYKVADRQVQRGRRLTRELGGAARRAGVGSAAEPVDAAERLLGNAFKLGLEWLETAALEPGGPLRRLARAEYEAIGSFLGLNPGLREQVMGRAQDAVRSFTQQPAAAVPVAAPAPPAQASPALPVRHAVDSAQRVVRVRFVEVRGQRIGAVPKLVFHHVGDRSAQTLSGQILDRAGDDELLLHTDSLHPGGLWRAAVCDSGGLQTGLIEIEL